MSAANGDGSRMYRVNWKNGIPFIEAGVTEFGGHKRRALKVTSLKDGRRHTLYKFKQSIEQALEADIEGTCFLVHIKRLTAWEGASCIASLCRLRDKLQSCGLTR